MVIWCEFVDVVCGLLLLEVLVEMVYACFCLLLVLYRDGFLML